MDCWPRPVRWELLRLQLLKTEDLLLSRWLCVLLHHTLLYALAGFGIGCPGPKKHTFLFVVASTPDLTLATSGPGILLSACFRTRSEAANNTMKQLVPGLALTWWSGDILNIVACGTDVNHASWWSVRTPGLPLPPHPRKQDGHQQRGERCDMVIGPLHCPTQLS